MGRKGGCVYGYPHEVSMQKQCAVKAGCTDTVAA